MSELLRSGGTQRDLEPVDCDETPALGMSNDDGGKEISLPKTADEIIEAIVALNPIGNTKETLNIRRLLEGNGRVLLLECMNTGGIIYLYAHRSRVKDLFYLRDSGTTTHYGHQEDAGKAQAKKHQLEFKEAVLEVLRITHELEEMDRDAAAREDCERRLSEAREKMNETEILANASVERFFGASAEQSDSSSTRAIGRIAMDTAHADILFKIELGRSEATDRKRELYQWAEAEPNRQIETEEAIRDHALKRKLDWSGEIKLINISYKNGQLMFVEYRLGENLQSYVYVEGGCGEAEYTERSFIDSGKAVEEKTRTFRPRSGRSALFVVTRLAFEEIRSWTENPARKYKPIPLCGMPGLDQVGWFKEPRGDHSSHPGNVQRVNEDGNLEEI